MNLFQNIKIDGEIFLEYAFLTYEISFDNKGNVPVSADYMFALPKGAVISKAKIICSDGEVITTSVISVTHAARLQEGNVSSALLGQLDDTSYMFSIGNLGLGISKLRLGVYAPLKNKGDGKTLVLPLTAGRGIGSGEKAYADISLIVHEECVCSSSTHEIVIGDKWGKTEIKTDKILADRDFCLKIKDSKEGNCGIAVQKTFGGELLCRLYPSHTQRKYEKMLIIFDGTGSLLYGTEKAGKELVCSLAKAFSGEVALVVSGEKPKMLTKGFCENTDENIYALTEKLSQVQVQGGSLGEAFELISGFVQEDTFIILVSGTNYTEGSISADKAKEFLADRGMNVVTLGATEISPVADAIKEACGGRREHIFGKDNIEERAKSIIDSFSVPEYKNVKVFANGVSGHIIDVDRGITAFFEYSGQRVPESVLVVQGADEEEIALGGVTTYHSFAPLGLVYAKALHSSLEKELKTCPPLEVSRIRKLMEEVGIKYSAINSETALGAVIGESKPSTIRVVVRNQSCDHQAFGNRASMFREETKTEISKEIAEICAEIIIKAMRADGAICADGEINQELRRGQTMVSLLSLVASPFGEKYRAFIEKGKKYIEDYTPYGLKFTQNREYAKEQLGKLWGNEEIIFDDNVPDLITAGKLLFRL